jgi:hypothetical protein
MPELKTESTAAGLRPLWCAWLEVVHFVNSSSSDRAGLLFVTYFERETGFEPATFSLEG